MDENNVWVLLQLCDSSFPVGSFAHSVGLEAAEKLKLVNNEHEFWNFTVSCLENGGSFSLPFVTEAYQNADSFQSIIDIDQIMEVSLTNHIANRASTRQGSALLSTAVTSFPHQQIRALKTATQTDKNFKSHFSVVFGCICNILGISLKQCQQGFMFGILRTIVAAGVRLGTVGTVRAQCLQYELQKIAEEIRQKNSTRTVEEACVCSPVVEIAQGVHETLFAKLFYS